MKEVIKLKDYLTHGQLSGGSLNLKLYDGMVKYICLAI